MKKIFTIIFLSSLLLCSVVFAADGDESPKGMTFDPQASDISIDSITNLNLGMGSPFQVIISLVFYASSFLGLLFLILIMYGGYVWMMARGNVEEVTKAKTILKRSAFGLIIILLSVSIAYLAYWLVANTQEWAPDELY